jgi:hypothetical protein
MLNWDIDNLKFIREEMVKQAQNDHLAQELIEENRHEHHTYNPALAWVGRRLVTVGAKIVAISGDEDQRAGYQPEIHLN